MTASNVSSEKARLLALPRLTTAVCRISDRFSYVEITQFKALCKLAPTPDKGFASMKSQDIGNLPSPHGPSIVSRPEWRKANALCCVTKREQARASAVKSAVDVASSEEAFFICRCISRKQAAMARCITTCRSVKAIRHFVNPYRCTSKDRGLASNGSFGAVNPLLRSVLSGQSYRGHWNQACRISVDRPTCRVQ